MRLDGRPSTTSPRTAQGRLLAGDEQRRRSASRATRLTPMFGGGPTLADAVITVVFDRDGALWAGTYDSGLWRYKDGALEHFTQKHGLSSDAIRALVHRRRRRALDWHGRRRTELAPGRPLRPSHRPAKASTATTSGRSSPATPDYLWLGTSLGLARIRRAALFAGTFRQSDDAMYAVSGGLRSSQCAPGFPTSSGGRLDSKGRAWVVTSNGLAMIEPGDIQPLDAAAGAADPRGERRRQSRWSSARRSCCPPTCGASSSSTRPSGSARPSGCGTNTGSKASTPTGFPPAPGVPPTTTTCRRATTASSSGRRSARRRQRAGHQPRVHPARVVVRGRLVPVGRAGRPGGAGLGAVLAAAAAGPRAVCRRARRAGAHLARAARHARAGLRRHLVAAQRRRQRAARRRRRWPRNDSRWRGV